MPINPSLSGTYISRRKSLWVLGFLWAVMQLLLLKQFGIVTNFEAAKYLEQAKALLTDGSFTTGNFLFYSTEILLIAFCLKLGVSLWFVVGIQFLMSAFSIFVFFRLVERLTSNHLIAFVASLLLAGMYYYQLYNVHLFTESLFFSFTILFTTYLFSLRRLTLKSVLGLCLSLVLLIVTRPTGLLFLPATLFYLIFRFGRKKALPIFLVTIFAGFVLFYFLLNAALGSGGELDFLLPYTEEHIICGVPTTSEPNAISLPVNKNSVAGLWYVITQNSELFFRLAKERFLAFWGVQRSYYSAAHNLFVAIYFYALYVFILIGLRRMFRNVFPHTIFLITYILLVMCTVLLSCDEWHNRFLYSILPLLLLMGTGRFIKKKAISQ